MAFSPNPFVYLVVNLQVVFAAGWWNTLVYKLLGETAAYQHTLVKALHSGKDRIICPNAFQWSLLLAANDFLYVVLSPAIKVPWFYDSTGFSQSAFNFPWEGYIFYGVSQDLSLLKY